MAIVKTEINKQVPQERGNRLPYMQKYGEISERIESAGKEGNLPKFMRLKRELAALTEPPMGSSC